MSQNHLLPYQPYLRNISTRVNKMNTLPYEVYLEIFSHLPRSHLRSVSLVCRSFAALTKPRRFEELVFHGDAQENAFTYEEVRKGWIGRSRTVEVTSIEDAVKEVLSLGIATHVKTFVFGPRYYGEGEHTIILD